MVSDKLFLAVNKSEWFTKHEAINSKQFVNKQHDTTTHYKVMTCKREHAFIFYHVLYYTISIYLTLHGDMNLIYMVVQNDSFILNDKLLKT